MFLKKQTLFIVPFKVFSSFSVYFKKLSATNYCTHTSINSITPHLPLKEVMGLFIVFLGYIYRVGWGPLWVGINYYTSNLLSLSTFNVLFAISFFESELEVAYAVLMLMQCSCFCSAFVYVVFFQPGLC
jgi:hypothetical protein